jgi:DNA polymerase III subunit delta'
MLSMTDEALPEADCIEGAPHPRRTAQLFGQAAAEAELLNAIASSRLHHAWLLSGPRGIGKATLAWRAARYLLAEPGDADPSGLFGETPGPATLDVAPDHPVARRLEALSEPGLLLIRRAWDHDRKRLKSQITVDEVRRLNGFFGLSASGGGRRIVIVDAADDMNTSAANALLKVLEEPPKGAVLFLVSHQPARLLPTIRSRCREIRLAPLAPEALGAALEQAGLPGDDLVALTAISGGSAGEAIRLIEQGGLALYDDLLEILKTCPQLDRSAVARLVDKATARGADDRLDLTVRLLDLALARLARRGTGLAPDQNAAQSESDLMARLSPDIAAARAWATLQQELGERIAHGRAVNIDAAALLTDAFLRVNETARQT